MSEEEVELLVKSHVLISLEHFQQNWKNRVGDHE